MSNNDNFNREVALFTGESIAVEQELPEDMDVMIAEYFQLKSDLAEAQETIGFLEDGAAVLKAENAQLKSTLDTQSQCLIDEVKLLCRDYSSRNGNVYIKDVEATLDALAERLKPESLEVPEGLSKSLQTLLHSFTKALSGKLLKSQIKYGYTDDWQNTDWEEKCQDELQRHVYKGDPLDVAAYCMFAWNHDWSTAKPELSIAVPAELNLIDHWNNFDLAYFACQSALYAFWGAIDVGPSRSFFHDLYANMHRLRRDFVQMLPDEIRNPKPETKEQKDDQP